MNTPLIIIFLGVIIAIAVAIKLLKGAVKIAFSVMGILFVALIIILGMAYLDARRMQGLMEEGDKVVLYERGGAVLAGAEVGQGGFLLQGEGELPPGMNVLGPEELEQYEAVMDEEAPTQEQELVLIVRNDTFDNYEPLTIGDVQVPRELFDAVMTSEEPKPVVAAHAQEQAGDERAAEEALRELEAYTDEELKTALFLMALNDFVAAEGEEAIIEEVRQDHIDVRPDFWLVRLVRFLPDGVAERALERTAAMSAEAEG